MLKSGRYRLATRFAGILLLLALFVGLRRTDEVSAQSTSGGRPIDLILLIDGSPSMKTTDPDNYRLDAARFLVDYLGAIGQVFDLNNRIAYAYFGSDVGRSQSLVTPQTGSVRDQLVLSTSDATDPALTGGTDFRTALQFALRELKGRGAARDRDVVVILFTDGHPAFAGLDATLGGIERYFRSDISDGKGAMPSLVGELKQLGANLFVVGIGEAQSDALNWEGLLGQKRFRTIGGAKLDSASELIGIYREFVAPFTDTDLSNSIRIVDGSEATVQQSGLLDGAVFSVVKAKNSSVLTLTTPAGRVIRPSLGGVGERYEIFAADPAAGAWRVRASGGDAVLFYDSRPARLNLVLPSDPLVAGDGIDAQLRLTLRGVVTAPIGFAPTLELLTSLNQRIQLPPMSSDAQNVFRVSISPTLVSLPGTYQLSPVLSGIYSASVRTATERFTTYLRPGLLSFDVQGVMQPGAEVTVTARIENASRLPPGYAPGLTLKDSAGRVLASPPMLAAERLARGNDVEQVYRAMVRLPSSEGAVLFELAGRGSSRDGVLFEAGSRYSGDMRYRPPTVRPIADTPVAPLVPGPSQGGELPFWLWSLMGGLVVAIPLSTLRHKDRTEIGFLSAKASELEARVSKLGTELNEKQDQLNRTKVRAEKLESDLVGARETEPAISTLSGKEAKRAFDSCIKHFDTSIKKLRSKTFSSEDDASVLAKMHSLTKLSSGSSHGVAKQYERGLGILLMESPNQQRNFGQGMMEVIAALSNRHQMDAFASVVIKRWQRSPIIVASELIEVASLKIGQQLLHSIHDQLVRSDSVGKLVWNDLREAVAMQMFPDRC